MKKCASYCTFSKYSNRHLENKVVGKCIYFEKEEEINIGDKGNSLQLRWNNKCRVENCAFEAEVTEREGGAT